jgi:hypothetical protein
MHDADTPSAPVCAGLEADRSESAQIAAAEMSYADNVPKFLTVLKVFFSNIPYDLTDRQNEQMW